MTKHGRALSLSTDELQGMDIETLQNVAQTLGVGPRQEREELIEAIQQQQRLETRRGTLHILFQGRAICGLMGFPPSSWPAGHWWVGLSEVKNRYRDSIRSAGQTWCTNCITRLNDY